MTESTDADERTYSEAELAIIKSNYKKIVTYWKISFEGYTVDTLQVWHRGLFDVVRPDFSGRLRSSYFGASIQMLGVYPSVERDQVLTHLQKNMIMAAGFDNQITAGNLSVEEMIRAAVILHCDLIRIQPFHDGNKQIGRLAMSYWLRKWNIPAPILQVPRSEYLTCVNSYLAGDRSCQSMLDLVIRLIDEQTR